MHTAGDVIHEKLYVECKYRIHFAIWRWFLEVEQQAQLEGKSPVLVLKEADREGELAVVRLAFLKELLDGQKAAGEGL